MKSGPSVECFERVFVLRPLVSEDLPMTPDKRTLTIPHEELERMRQNPLVAEEFHSDPTAPRYRVLGRTSDGFLIVTGDPQK